MNTNIKIKLKYSQIIKLIYGLIIIIFIIISYGLTNFLYKNFYRVITYAERITILKEEVTTEIIDAALFEKVLNHLNEKQKTPSFDIKDIKDIFSQVRSKSIINPNPSENIDQLLSAPSNSNAKVIPEILP